MNTRLTATIALALIAAPLAALAQQAPGAQNPRMERLDADKDGAVSKDEFRAGRAADFAALSPNGQAVAVADMPAALERLREQRRAERQKAMAARLDADSDGRISKAEFEAGADRMFERMDRDDDGRLTRDDRRGHHGGHHGGKGRD
ncbi:MAG TPA: hypothetical protein VED40_14355 [Azospirillaceae bacterium]|nr:hypothetical protein [Azospirillaceae bacterium]